MTATPEERYRAREYDRSRERVELPADVLRAAASRLPALRLGPLSRDPWSGIRQRRRVSNSGPVLMMPFPATEHDVQTVGLPYEDLTPEPTFTGHSPERQYVSENAGQTGVLEIVTAIGEDSSNTFSKVEVQIRIEPRFGNPYSSLWFRPFVDYWAQRYLSSGGTGSSHSSAQIRSTVVSTDADGSDGAWEGERGVALWDDRCSGLLSELGHELDSADPDLQGTVAWQDLEVHVRMQRDRIYYGRVRIESNSDADGSHLFYASHASVALYATVRQLVVEQAGEYVVQDETRG